MYIAKSKAITKIEKYEKCHVHAINNLSVKDEKPFESVTRTSHICRLNVNPGYGKSLFKNMNEIW